MSSVTVKVEGVDNLKKALDARQKAIKEKIKLALKMGAVAIHKQAVNSIARESKSGRMYGDHQASAPFEAPATDSGALVRSIRMRSEDGGMTMYVTAGGSDAPYAGWLEFGVAGPRGWALAPRPFMVPAYRDNVPDIGKAIKAAQV